MSHVVVAHGSSKARYELDIPSLLLGVENIAVMFSTLLKGKREVVKFCRDVKMG